MKSISFLILVVTAAFVSSAQPPTDWKQLQLKGKVKSLKTQETYRYKKTGNWTEWEKSYARQYQFNHTGQKTAFQESGTNGQLLYKTLYTYNVKDKKTELSNFDKEGNRTGKTVFLLDNKGNQVEELNYSRGDTLYRRYTSTYDQKGRRTSTTGYKPDGTLLSKTSWTYDDINKSSYYKIETPGYANSSRKFIYDDKGNTKEDFFYDGQEKISYRYVRSYDDKDNKIEELTYKGQDQLRSMSKWRYEYDKTGNWTKRTETTSDGMDFHIEERIITYY